MAVTSIQRRLGISCEIADVFAERIRSVTSPDEIANLIVEATEHPDLYHFTPILELKSLQNDTDKAEFKKMLETFSYGCIDDYKGPLSERQRRKLQELTIVSIAATSESPEIPYTVFMNRIHLQSSLELQDLLVSAIFQGLIAAKLSSSRQMVIIENAIARDIQTVPHIPKDQIEEMLTTLRGFSSRCENVIAAIQSEIDTSNRALAEREQRKRDIAAEREQVIAKLRSDARVNEGRIGKGKGKEPMTEDSMELDSPRQTRKRKGRVNP